VEWETDIVNAFRNNPERGEISGTRDTPTGRSLYLARPFQIKDKGCLACHTTAFDLPGGFAATDRASAHPDLARVGCESCHGPGEAHVAPKAERIGTIISLGDKCDSCVILQICGGCHDDANDPGFAFEVEAKIEKQRHGTVEAGTRRKVAAPAASGTASP